MIRIAVAAAAFEAVAGRLPLGTVSFERERTDQGERSSGSRPTPLKGLRAARGPGESYSDVILRLVELEAKGEV